MPKKNAPKPKPPKGPARIQAAEDMDDETFIKHMNARHMPYQGVAKIDEMNFVETVSKSWRAAHNRMHREECNHTHSEPKKEADILSFFRPGEQVYVRIRGEIKNESWQNQRSNKKAIVIEIEGGWNYEIELSEILGRVEE